MRTIVIDNPGVCQSCGRVVQKTADWIDVRFGVETQETLYCMGVHIPQR